MTESEPAFPTNQNAYDGMTLRDYFAAAAITGITGSDLDVLDIHCQTTDNDNFPQAQAIAAYEIADAMIRVREDEEDML